jgi:lysophospholipase L1-like esterase
MYKMNRIILLLTLYLIFQINLQAKQKPTVFTIGDSTVKNGQGNGAGGFWGWGDPIAQYFDTTKVVMKNRALGGTSSRTFQTKGLWNEVLKQLKKGDFVLMQFGHNDGSAINDDNRARGTIKGVGEETEEIENILTKEHETVHSYGLYMKKYIRETQAKGAVPVVLSMIPRNIWKDGKVERASEMYGKWAKKVAESSGAFFIDLNELVAVKYEEMGTEKVMAFFPGDHMHNQPPHTGFYIGDEMVTPTKPNLKLIKYK